MSVPSITIGEIGETAESSGFTLCGVSEGVVLPSEEQERLASWQGAGYAGEMAYMDRSVEERCDASHFEPWVRTVLSFAVPYEGRAVSAPARKGYGKVARYAWGRDYHKVLKKKLTAIGRELAKNVEGSFNWRPVTDSFPLLERAFASRASLGFIGKNTMLIRPKVGSFVFLAEVLTDLTIEGEVEPLPQGECGTCASCLSACPTDAFTAPYSLDARRCISYLTIEKRGAFTEWERSALGDWVFGCDVCQEVCPFNHRAQQELVPLGLQEFSPESGTGGEISLAELLSISTAEEFKQRFAGTPLLRPGRDGLLRNAICVAVHQGCRELIPQIESLASQKEVAALQDTARWALECLG